MSTKIVSPALLAALVIAAIGGPLSPTVASAGQTGCPHCQETCQTCKLEAELVDIEEKCFEVEEKVICIPRVVFPWQTGNGWFSHGKKKGFGTCDSCDGRGCSSCNACVHNGAKTRKIKVLKSSKKDGCPVCEYTWSAEKKACSTCCNSGCCGSCSGQSSDAGCADYPCDAAPIYVDPVAAGELMPAQVQ